MRRFGLLGKTTAGSLGNVISAISGGALGGYSSGANRAERLAPGHFG
jgi:hypothetical protein